MEAVLRSCFHENHRSPSHSTVFGHLSVARDLHVRPTAHDKVNFVLLMGCLLIDSILRKHVDAGTESGDAKEFQIALAAGGAFGLQFGEGEKSLHVWATIQTRRRK